MLCMYLNENGEEVSESYVDADELMTIRKSYVEGANLLDIEYYSIISAITEQRKFRQQVLWLMN